MIAHVGSPGSHGAECVTEYMDYNTLKRVSHPPYSPDLASSDFYLFGYFEHQSQGHEFTEGAEFGSAISEILNRIPADTLGDVFNDWMIRLQRPVDVNGGDVE
jgi:hypothetical protein